MEDGMTKKNGATIEAGGTGVALVNLYEVAPDRQGELISLLGEVTEKVIRHQPGFLSVCVHASLDGTRVVNYAQWASKEDFERMLKNPDALAQFRRLAGVAKSVAPVLYKVAAVHTG
jgi:quinol monooxygenase YgiN